MPTWKRRLFPILSRASYMPRAPWDKEPALAPKKQRDGCTRQERVYAASILDEKSRGFGLSCHFRERCLPVDGRNGRFMHRDWTGGGAACNYLAVESVIGFPTKDSSGPAGFNSFPAMAPGLHGAKSSIDCRSGRERTRLIGGIIPPAFCPGVREHLHAGPISYRVIGGIPGVKPGLPARPYLQASCGGHAQGSMDDSII